MSQLPKGRWLGRARGAHVTSTFSAPDDPKLDLQDSDQTAPLPSGRHLLPEPGACRTYLPPPHPVPAHLLAGGPNGSSVSKKPRLCIPCAPEPGTHHSLMEAGGAHTTGYPTLRPQQPAHTPHANRFLSQSAGSFRARVPGTQASPEERPGSPDPRRPQPTPRSVRQGQAAAGPWATP